MKDRKRKESHSNILVAEVLNFQKQVLEWFTTNGRSFPWRKRHTSNYQRIVSEVLLQRTKAETVAGFYSYFFKKYPSWKKLAKATEKEVGEFLKPIGLWQRRAVSITKLAKVMDVHGGRFPRTREEIESLPNVGQYIANAVLLFCHGEPQPLLDASMARILERCFGPRKLSDIRYDPYLQELAKMVVTCSDPMSTNWAMLDLAATICIQTQPKCFKCPLTMMCHSAGHRV